LHFLHFPSSKINEIKGILSYQLIFFLHFGQNDLPVTICLFKGRRYMHTLAKLPKIKPRKKINIE